ncbi:MAG: protein kinase, partial [Gammaproteobacteria bacterium]|nr:protein kinase [Gammaproteobacteria bacterium]
MLRRTLGKGAQGTVYLAHDPKLGRDVAIKTLNRDHHDDARLLSEARNAARLSHPNVVPLYELGVHKERPYLVYQYAAGQPLASVLAAESPLAPHRAITMLGQLLDGIASAHALGVLHRDLTPANVMVGEDDSVRILDFGIACAMKQDDVTAGIAGTVNYIAPEVLDNKVPDARSDLFSLAAMLYEMLTGRRAFDADSPMAVAYKIVNEPVRPPSRLAPAVDPGLDDLVQKALAKDPDKRFDSAEAFKRALDDYLAQGSEAGDVARSDSDAVNFLLRRINRKPDFPAISEHINEINRKAGSNNPNDAGDLAGVVLKDMGLTGKLLRLVNSAVYGQYGGQVTTISRAVVILGFEQVRAAALSIILFEQVKNGQQADRLKDSACCSFLSAMIARNLANGNEAINAEEAFISAMFNRIGRHLAIFFFPDECDEIDALSASRGISEE